MTLPIIEERSQNAKGRTVPTLAKEEIMNNETGKMFQISTLQALSMGYTRSVITVEELLDHGDTGLGTFEDVNGEMIVADGCCYKAGEDGAVVKAPLDEGVPFASVTHFSPVRSFKIMDIESIDKLKDLLDLKIEEWFGLNSMHVVRIDGEFERISARSESAFRSQHISLKKILDKTQKSFEFDDISGTLICVYYPDYMDGINAPGWHLHFLSEDRTKGGHTFDLIMKSGTAKMEKISNVEIQLPTEPAFDTYSLKQASGDEIKQVEQGK